MRIPNKRAKQKYEVIKRLEAGVVLSGLEARAVQLGKADLSRAFAKIVGGELFLINLGIHTKGGKGAEENRRTRKLLAHRKEIDSLVIAIKTRKLTMVPLSLYNKGRLVKVELGLVRDRRKHEKKEILKRRDIEREVEKELKDY